MAKGKKKKRKRKHRFLWFIMISQMFLILLVLGALGYYYFGGYAQEVQQLKAEAAALVKNSDENTFIPSQTSFVYDKAGNLISERSGEKEAKYVVYEDIPAPFITAIISIEDKKFFKHNGVDFKAVLRAAKAMVENGKITQGGSTITMQLAKLIYMESGRTWQYKVEQMFLAMELEKQYSKSKILEFYLNNVYFANGYYGIEAACHGYFDCELKDLDISQIAFLLAIPNSPTYYNPLSNGGNTMKRRDLILRNMRDDGRITQEEYESAVAEDIVLNLPKKEGGLWNNYVDTYTYHCATKAMMQNLGFEFRYYFSTEEEAALYHEEYDELYARCQKKLYTGGYKIYTSIDMNLQQELQEAIDRNLEDFTEIGDEGMYSMQGAATCIDNETGLVAAIVGGRSQDFSMYTLNRAYQSHRQPGSSIKPLIVYTPCFERGYDLDSMVDDHELEDGPENSTGGYAGEVTVRYAVQHSLNTVAWQLYEELTPEVGLQYLKDMNFTNIVETDYVLATALGGFTTGVSSVEMASAYAALENDGVFRQPSCIQSIVDSNENVVYDAKQEERRIYSETSARMMTSALVSVIEEGTGRNMKLEEMPAAGKTGTTNEHKDGWFVGYTRYYTTSVWVGYDMPRTVENLKGNTYPGKIWKEFMDRAHEGLPVLSFLPYAQLSEDFMQQEEEQEQQRQEEQERYEQLQEEWNQQQQGEGQEEQPEEEPPEGESLPEEEQPPEAESLPEEQQPPKGESPPEEQSPEAEILQGSPPL